MRSRTAVVIALGLALVAVACTGEIVAETPRNEGDPHDYLGLPDAGERAQRPEDPDIPAGAYCDAAATWDSDRVDWEDRLLALINEVRLAGTACGGTAMGATHPLTSNGALLCAARNHSRDMHDRDYFSHSSPEGEGPQERIERAGYSWSAWGENIIAGTSSPEAMLAGWLGSAGHCRNIMDPTFTDTGLGYYDGANGRYATQVFGRAMR